MSDLVGRRALSAGRNSTLCHTPRSTEEVEVHLLLLLLFLGLLHLLFLRSRSVTATAAATGCWCRSNRVCGSVSLRIREELLHRFHFLESEVDVRDQRSDVPERIPERMRQSRFRGDPHFPAECSHVGDTTEEFPDQNLVLDVKHGRGEDAPVLEDFRHLHAILERPDVQLLQQHCCARGDLLARLQDGELRHQLNLALHNLGSNVQSLEEGSLRGIHACWP
mmetsp:Transcript_99645/g.321252  ORF Transcript_99645/g.321252 Transcript_99645/m.321252 type:complete len:222 (-) Transcript_99645:483-1148(-)